VLEVHGDFWTYGPVHARGITTNGVRKLNGAAVMGRGVARQALERYPGIDLVLGHELRWGNHVFVLKVGRAQASPAGQPILFNFPVKHHWREPADLNLITRSANELVRMAGELEWHRVLLPRPGCGNGGLDWRQVGPVLDQVLDDRFHVITW